jgi:PleD family two-component response regulator
VISLAFQRSEFPALLVFFCTVFQYLLQMAISEDRFPKINGVFQDFNFFQFHYFVRTPNIRSIISLNNRSKVRGVDSSLRSNNNFITDNTEKQRILVVDDDRDISNLYKLSLEHDGFIVHSFNDPLLALSSYKAGAYDL